MASVWRLDPSVRYLNHGSFGACPEPVLAAQQRWRDELERNPVEFFTDRYWLALDIARAQLAQFVGADPLDLVFVPNATTAVNAVLRSLELVPGDELLATNHGYGACRNVLDYVAERAGARVVVAEVPFPVADPAQVVEAIAAAVTARTRVALVDHVTSSTGLVFPLERIAAVLADQGVPLLVDGAHAPGMVPLGLQELGVPYYTGNLHKWVCAPKGAAFLYVRRALQPAVRPTVISHGATLVVPDRPKFWLEFDWTGTLDPSAWLAVPDALAFLRQIAPDGVAAHMVRNHELARAARRLVAEALEIDLPAPDSMIGALASVPLPDAAGPACFIDPLQRWLRSEHQIEVPIVSWPAHPRRLIRISAQAYNQLEDYGHLAGALSRIPDTADTG